MGGKLQQAIYFAHQLQRPRRANANTHAQKSPWKRSNQETRRRKDPWTHVSPSPTRLGTATSLHTDLQGPQPACHLPSSDLWTDTVTWAAPAVSHRLSAHLPKPPSEGPGMTCMNRPGSREARPAQHQTWFSHTDTHSHTHTHNSACLKPHCLGFIAMFLTPQCGSQSRADLAWFPGSRQTTGLGEEPHRWRGLVSGTVQTKPQRAHNTTCFSRQKRLDCGGHAGQRWAPVPR
jgi:hypothetical protein